MHCIKEALKMYFFAKEMIISMLDLSEIRQ
jgi:hypothetical protein